MSFSSADTSSSEPSEKFIDTAKVIASKNPRLLKIMPGFLLRYIKRVIHEDELNDAISRNKNRFEHDFVDAAMEEFGVHIKVVGEENIPESGGVIIAANHPLGALDGIAFMKVVGKRRKDIRFLVNDLLMALKNFGPLFVPVNKHGRNSQDYVERIEKVYAEDDCVLIFPAGLVSRRQKGGVIEDLEWKRSFINKAVHYKKNIVPVYIEGRNSNFFYNLAYWRKKLGIRANIEMFYLVDEMYQQKGKTLTFTFGKPISWQVFTSEQKDEYWAEKVKRHVYALKTGDKTKMLPTILN
ncbi:MAG: 1-acyl-sn-glycerol-3-phosphate acyltransferase [Bacteroidia bacterium]